MATATLKVPTVFTAKDNFSGVVKSMTKTTSKFKNRAAGLERFNNKLNGMRYQALAVGAGIAFAVKNANNFNTSMGNINTLIDSNVENLGNMGQEVLLVQMPVLQLIVLDW